MDLKIAAFVTVEDVVQLGARRLHLIPTGSDPHGCPKKRIIVAQKGHPIKLSIFGRDEFFKIGQNEAAFVDHGGWALCGPTPHNVDRADSADQ